MDYNKIYFDIIEKRKREVPSGYCETHHIVPRCLGGTDDKSNLITLTAREHYLAHYLLCKIYPNNSRLWYAFGCMTWLRSNTQSRYVPSRTYSKLREEFSRACSKMSSGDNNSQFGTRWISSIETKKSFKIPRNAELPFGCIEGRVLDWSKHYTQRPCKRCGKVGCLSALSKFCSDVCKTSLNSSFMDDIRSEFLDVYRKTKSLNKALKHFGFVNAGGYRDIAIRTINESGDIDLREMLETSKKKK